MNNSGFLKVVIVLLLLINGATLTCLWMGNRPYRDGSPRHGGGPGDFLIRELKLDSRQQELFLNMRDQHHEAMSEMRADAAGYRSQINTQMNAVNPDSLLIRQLCDSIGFRQRDVDLITFYHFRDLRKICNPQQQQKFDLIIRDAIQMIVREH